MFDWKGVDGRVMGVINVTPDSFSDGGRYLDPDSAIAHGLELAAEGAAMLDVGGASSRPGAAPVDPAEEARRVVPVIRGLADETAVPISVDTMSAQVAEAALDAGAVVVNDVSAGRLDPTILDVTAAGGAGYVAVHMQGEPRTMQDDPRYDDVVGEVGEFLRRRLEAASAAGIRDAALMADPGIGFGKTIDHNLELLARLRELVEQVHAPLLIGTSRKTFIGRILGVDDPERRDDGTLATVVWSLDRGAAMVRVHDVRRAVQVAKVLAALARVSPAVRA
ncbi:MAG TPA: dihydropteroate synthase [Acidimicrobiia bacterium]|jgi:dihydropteroate synthase